MDMQRFYQITYAFLSGGLVVNSEFATDPYKFMRGEQEVQTPVLVNRSGGHKLYDVIHGSAVGVLLFHNRFFKALRAERVTGFDSLPASIMVRDKTVDDYSFLVVKGRAYGIDDYKGEVIDKGPIVPGGASVVVKRGLYFDEGTWDGSDIFLLDETLFIIVTEKVMNIIKNLAITNLTCTDTEMVESDIHHNALDRPELLQYYMGQLKSKPR